MPKKTLAEQIRPIAQEEIRKIPVPEPCTVIKNYPNKQDRVDVETPNGKLIYVKCLFNNTVGHQGVIIYLNNDINKDRKSVV